MQRFGLRDDQWAQIKDFLPGRDGHVGGNPAEPGVRRSRSLQVSNGDSLA